MTDPQFQKLMLKMSGEYNRIFEELYIEGRIVEKPFYSEVYDLSYGQASSSYKTYLDILHNHFGEKDRNLLIGELFGGQGFELDAIRRNAVEKGHDYISLDYNHDYHIKHEGLKYVWADLIKGEDQLTEEERFDFLFCGAVNISHSSIVKVKDFQSHAKWCGKVVKPGGLLMCSVQNIPSDDDTLSFDYHVWPINYGEHAGKYIMWFSMVEHTRSTNTVNYSNLCALTKNKFATKTSEIEFAWSTSRNEGGVFKNWDESLIIDMVTAEAQFLHRPELYPEDSSENLIFERI